MSIPNEYTCGRGGFHKYPRIVLHDDELYDGELYEVTDGIQSIFLSREELRSVISTGAKILLENQK